MAQIELQNVSVSFPIFNANARSLKKQFLRLATGGNVSRDANKKVVVNSLNNINVTFKHGDRVGLIGHNGAGKSTLLKVLANIYEPSSGRILIEGHVSPMLSLTHGIEGEFTGHENIVQRGIIYGLTRGEIMKQADYIADMTGLGDYLYMPVRTYSTGMMVRLAFAISTCINPEILVIDEIFGAGDAAFMEKASAKMVELLDKSSIFVMASHSNDLVKKFCNKGLLLDGGHIKYFGDVKTAIEIYTSPGN